MVKRFFGKLIDKAIHSCIFHFVPDLTVAIEACLSANQIPLIWTVAAWR